MKCLKYILIILLLISNLVLTGQNEEVKTESKKSSADKVINSLKKNQPDNDLASGYEDLAKELLKKNDFEKAEDYFKRARELYKRLNNKEKIAAIDRELAKIRESQNKYDEAIKFYNSASSNSSDKKMKNINNNDAQRLSNYSNPKLQQAFIEENIIIADELDNKDEKVTFLQQRAQTKFQLDDNTGAINDLQSALETVEKDPEKTAVIYKEISDIYIADNQLDKAIDINKEAVESAQQVKNTDIQIKQLQTLSSNYFNASKTEEGLLALHQAYDLAMKEGRTMDAKKSLEMLVNKYKDINDYEKAIEKYSDFISNLDDLIKNDSTLIDEKYFQVQEERILQLEKEKDLKDQIIAQSNTFNTVLLTSVILILISLFFIVKALYSIKKKNKKIALQSLRREMNPHFIFNSLNSINQFISQNNELEANKYLSSYSKLMRNIMENSNKDFIPLSTEIEYMKEYLELEHMRFNDKFNYEIYIDDSIDADSTMVPNMLIQPQLENSIWHGLRYRSETGLLKLSITTDKKNIIINIEDNGVGIAKSNELKTKFQREHRSRGLKNTYERIDLLNNIYNTGISINISEKQGKETGVVVIIQFPVINKKMN
ncbi:MAG: histidine kinase [Bacteroidales bacterium]|jgi:hypothetical protein|nr:histidine kinase [Bacteroidales bacterium]